MSDRTPPDGRPLTARPSRDAKSRKQRSAVTNGTRLFVEGDEQSPWARRYRDLIALHLDDLGKPEDLSEAQFSIVRRAAGMTVQLEQIEAQMSLGAEVDLAIYVTMSNALRRLLETIGIKRERREKTLAEQMREIEGR